MGTYNNGILGGFSGKVGPVVGATWRNKQIIRSRPSKPSNSPTPAQQRQRDKMALVSGFLIGLKPLLQETFESNTGNSTAFNNAMAYHLTNAVLETSGNLQINYSKVLIGMGGLCGLDAPTLSLTNPTTVALNWIDNSNQGYAYPDDRLIVVAYAPEWHLFDIMSQGYSREDGSGEVSVPETFIGLKVHFWASFYSETYKQSATSRYLGLLQL
ncbi:DUF6266 family protein [Formosa maritima]|uniref:Uncharacterized protein n=1 Tax=Formosa maritima TaxID=2592046 RepID=A0A5D0GJI5_9FLAO|nr:DUF6266 family protein [Formosa maritima]TYA59016.1 hypothetical protein FVF61_02380 [Formosa maritima]